MREQYKNFDKDLLKNDFLNRHTECLPFIGEKYKETRLLLIGESHYIPKESVKYVTGIDFYKATFDELVEGDRDEEKYKGWINTRRVFESRVYDKCDFKKFFSNIATEIARAVKGTDELSLEQKIQAMHLYAFINYFKRPSYEEGKTIRELTDEDYRYAYDISSYIINALKPELIIFISQKAYNAFCELDEKNSIRSKYRIESVSHPSCCWWNRERKDGECGKIDFYNLVKELKLSGSLI